MNTASNRWSGRNSRHLAVDCRTNGGKTSDLDSQSTKGDGQEENDEGLDLPKRCVQINSINAYTIIACFIAISDRSIKSRPNDGIHKTQNTLSRI